MGKRILAIGGHIGDAELTAGPLMASNAIDGGENVTLAMTAGERGNPPHMTPEAYREQKVSEAAAFAAMVNGRSLVLPYPDGELPNTEEVRYEVASVIRAVKPDLIVTHWRSAMHKDHNATHLIVRDAQFLASVAGSDRVTGARCYAPVYFAENWEDDGDFSPYIYVDVTRGFGLWQEAIRTQWFVMNSKDFAYYDYYNALARMRGCLNKTLYASAFAVEARHMRVKRDML